MSNFANDEQIVEDRFKKFIPVVTIFLGLICIVLFIGINLESTDNVEVYKLWGAPSVIEIFNGDYWGLITSNFLHVEFWIIGFNLYALWYLGRKIEFESSKLFYVFIIISSALIASASQLAFSPTTGMGLSGVLYSFFGYIYIKGKFSDEYQDYMSVFTIRFVFVWLILSIILSHTKVWEFVNAAAVGGLIYGVFLGFISKFNFTKQAIAVIVFISIVTSSIFWSPLSTGLLSHKAFQLHNDQHFDEAIILYKQILDRDSENEFAQMNLRQLEIYMLGQKAVKLEESNQYEEAGKIYEQIIEIDSSNLWAKGRLNSISNE